jgi:hypothetical protein
MPSREQERGEEEGKRVGIIEIATRALELFPPVRTLFVVSSIRLPPPFGIIKRHLQSSRIDGNG